MNSIFTGMRVAMRIEEAGYGVMLRKGSDLKAPRDADLDGLRKSGDLEKILARHGQGTETAKEGPARP